MNRSMTQLRVDKVQKLQCTCRVKTITAAVSQTDRNHHAVCYEEHYIEPIFAHTAVYISSSCRIVCSQTKQQQALPQVPTCLAVSCSKRSLPANAGSAFLLVSRPLAIASLIMMDMPAWWAATRSSPEINAWQHSKNLDATPI